MLAGRPASIPAVSAVSGVLPCGGGRGALSSGGRARHVAESQHADSVTCRAAIEVIIVCCRSATPGLAVVSESGAQGPVV